MNAYNNIYVCAKPINPYNVLENMLMNIIAVNLEKMSHHVYVYNIWIYIYYII